MRQRRRRRQVQKADGGEAWARGQHGGGKGTGREKIKKHVAKLGIALVLAALIGWTGSEAFNNGR